MCEWLSSVCVCVYDVCEVYFNVLAMTINIILTHSLTHSLSLSLTHSLTLSLSHTHTLSCTFSLSRTLTFSVSHISKRVKPSTDNSATATHTFHTELQYALSEFVGFVTAEACEHVVQSGTV
jgi:hypothetical protein